MGKFSVPAPPETYSKIYSNFKGVDFNADEATVSQNRFPYAQNLTFDKTGFPEKRPGYEAVSQFDGEIHSFGEFEMLGEKKKIVHAGNKIYFTDNKKTTVLNKPIECVAYEYISDTKREGEFIFEIKNSGMFINWQDVAISEVKIIAINANHSSNIGIYNNNSDGSNTLLKRIAEGSYYEGESFSSGLSGEVRTTKSLLTRSKIQNAFSNSIKILNNYILKVGEKVSFTVPYGCDNNIECIYVAAVKFYVRQEFKTAKLELNVKSPSGSVSTQEVNCGSYNKNTYYDGKPWYITINQPEEYVIPDYDSQIVAYENCALIKGNGFFTVVTPYGCFEMNDIAYSPLTEIGRDYASSYAYSTSAYLGASSNTPGQSYENVNLLSRKRTETFALTNWITSNYYASGLTTQTIYTEVYVSCDISKIERVEYLSSDGYFYIMDPTFFEKFSKNTIRFYKTKENPGTGAWWTKGVPYIPSALGGNTTENLRITYYAKVDENSSTYEESIAPCDISATFGVGKDDRLFLTGNPDKNNYVWYSDYDDFTYFPDLNYLILGNSSSKVLGFAKQGSNLIGFKENKINETSVFLISGSLAENGDALFTVTQGISGVGTLGKDTVSMIDDSPVFLSKNGIYQLISSNVKSEKSVVNISCFVNKKLTDEADLEKASLIRFKDMLLLGVNGNVYVLYTDKKTYFETLEGEFAYECMFWTNIPADKYYSLNDELYFSSYDGNKSILFKFKEFDGDVDSFNDSNEFAENEEDKVKAINSYFLTIADTDGSFMRLKTMVKRGCGIMIKPFIRSSAKVYVLTETNHEKLIKEGKAGVFSFENFYFDTVDFNSRDCARIIPFNAKIKKYSMLQFMVINDSVNEGFGVYGIEKRYTIGNFKKY